MNDSSRFGLAKSFFMMGHEAGFDMTSQEGLEEFQQVYNADMIPKMAAQAAEPFGLFGGLDLLASDASDTKTTRSKVSKEKQKKTRGIAKESRKRNRTKKK